MSSGVHKNAKRRIVADVLSQHLGVEYTREELAILSGLAPNSVSSAITALVKGGWVITKPTNASYVCHREGKYIAQRNDGPRPISLRRAHELVEQRGPVYPGEQPALPPVVVPEPNGVPAPGDVMEVTFISRHGTVYLEDVDGNHWTAKLLESA